MLTCDRSTSLLLGFKRQVQIFEPATGRRRLNFLAQLRRRSCLSLNRPQDRGLPLGQRPKLSHLLFDRQQLVFVQTVGLVFAKPGYKRDRVSAVQQSDRRFDVLRSQLEIAGNDCDINFDGIHLGIVRC